MIVGDAGPQIPPQALYPLGCRRGIVAPYKGVIGRYDGHTLMGGLHIHRIAVPGTGGVVHMSNHHAMSSAAAHLHIPSVGLTVLQNIILISIEITHHLPSATA